MRFTTLFFDLDDTLYASTTGLWDAIRDRMTRYMSERLGLPEAQIPALRRQYYETYGTTLRGLQAHHHVDADDYLAYVHDLPLHDYLRPAPELRRILLSLPQRRWIFTNADAAHARRVLAEIGLSDCFQGVIDIRAIGFSCKPERSAYLKALELAGEADPCACVFFDDSPRNLAPARELGFFTILVGSGEPDPAACRSVGSLHQLPGVVPELWPNGHASEGEMGAEGSPAIVHE